MSTDTTVQPETQVDVAVEPPDVVETPFIEAPEIVVSVIPTDGDSISVETTQPTIDAQVELAPVVEAQVTVEDGVEAQVITSGFITVVQDGGDVGFVEWAEFTYLNTGITLIKELLAGNVVTAVKVVVLEVFDGSPVLTVGTSADPDLWLSLDAVELSIPCEYHNESLVKFSTAEEINLSLSAPGSTQGRIGLLYRVIL